MRVLWTTNLAAPYRVPVWTSIAEKTALTVLLLESNAQSAADRESNRGSDWQYTAPSAFTIEAASTIKIPYGEARFYLLRNVAALTKIRNFDLIVFGGWESPAYWQLLLAAVVFRRRRVAFYESPANTHTYKQGLVARMRSLFYRSMHRVVVPGPAARTAVLGMGLQPHVVAEGFNAVDVAKFRARRPRHGEGSTSSGHNFLFAGQLIARKRIAEVIPAFGQICLSSDRFTIAGVGPMEDELKDLAGSQPGQIAFRGYVRGDQMPDLMAEHHTLVLASSQEVWGLVVNEALASGMHVVVTENCGVVPSVLGMSGVFVVREDLSDLAQRMQESRDSWRGRIPNPQILEYTPEKFAAVFQNVFSSLLTASERERRI